MNKYLAALAIVVASTVPTVYVTAAAARPSPLPLKACSAYSKEHFHGVTAHLPDGTKCLESG